MKTITESTIHYQGLNREITRELINRILDEQTDTMKYAAGFSKESNLTIQKIRNLEFDAKMELADEGKISTTTDRSAKQASIRRNAIVTRIIEKLTN